jgi:ribosomal protein S27E
VTDCARRCTLFRRHLTACPVPDGASQITIKEATEEEPAERHTCRGCSPRWARYGALCEPCHLRLEGWLTKTPETGSIAWAYDWLDEDRIPGGAVAGTDKIKTVKKVPPAALNLMVHDLRQDIAKHLGQWLRAVTSEFDLHGPDWWAQRVENRRDVPESWRAWQPQTSAEVTDAQRYLSTWLDRIEGVAGLAIPIYDEARELISKVKGLAPWEAQPRKLRGVPCPECERAALAIYEGKTVVDCMRCGAVFGRERYDIWSEMIEAEREAS